MSAVRVWVCAGDYICGEALWGSAAVAISRRGTSDSVGMGGALGREGRGANLGAGTASVG